MKVFRAILLLLGIALVLYGVVLLTGREISGCIAPLSLGITMVLMCWFRTRTTILVFGHTCIIVGCYLVTWGVYLAPRCEPVFRDIVRMPLFWGLFSIFGGICANFHGFCRCVQSLDPHAKDKI
ncbi:MAG: hypothetical protein JW828_02690 [Sedimentisphaerales bacterium]|nr:hypothetical protein [Sedimentisphaerales bacterium]